MGAIGEGAVRVLNQEVLRATAVSPAELAEVEHRERTELDRRARVYRGDRPRVDLVGRVAVVVDDGVATGSTARAACQVAKAQGAARVVLAAPVAPTSTATSLRSEVEVVCVLEPEDLWAIGQWYRDFSQTSDEEVTRLLGESALLTAVSPHRDGPADPPTLDDEVEVVAGSVRLAGRLTVPEQPAGMVVFAHGSGSSRRSPRNWFVAQSLNRAGLGTLLFDLLTARDEIDRSKVFDIELLAGRLGAVTDWLQDQPALGDLPLGYFGASTGAGAALWAAADPDADVAAVVSRGGRPDLAGPRLTQVRAPTLLIVGGLDGVVLELNRQAQARLRCENRLAVVPGATHLFEEPGTLAAAAGLAEEWLLAHMVAAIRSV
jgi:putative phosphoribosyl transferase